MSPGRYLKLLIVTYFAGIESRMALACFTCRANRGKHREVDPEVDRGRKTSYAVPFASGRIL
jgi:hypothetical protein